MKRTKGPAARAALLERNIMLKSMESFGIPSPDDQREFDKSLLYIKSVTHELGRGKQDIAIQLGLNVKELESMFVGKTVLDIGCGIGKLSDDIASIKKTKVTALDHNPDVLAKVPRRKNLTTMEGSGFDLQATLGDAKFDVVISSFSSLLWARNAEEKVTSIDSALQATASGGITIFIPVAQNIQHREKTRLMVGQIGYLEGHGFLNEADRIRILKEMKVADYLEVVTIDRLLEVENVEAGTVDFSYNPAPPIKGIPQEAYSAIVQLH